MAASLGRTSRTGRKRVNYDVLNNLSSADVLFVKNTIKRRSYVNSIGVYEAERVIASRNDGEVCMKKFVSVEVKYKSAI